jgi:hypothetical protein
MEFFIFIIAWLVLCGAAAAYASGKGRSGAGIFFLSFFLSPLVGFIVALVMEPNQQAVAEKKGMRKCPELSPVIPDRFCSRLFRLSWKWRKRSSVKIAERTYEKRAQALHC